MDNDKTNETTVNAVTLQSDVKTFQTEVQVEQHAKSRTPSRKLSETVVPEAKLPSIQEGKPVDETESEHEEQEEQKNSKLPPQEVKKTESPKQVSEKEVSKKDDAAVAENPKDRVKES